MQSEGDVRPIARDVISPLFFVILFGTNLPNHSSRTEYLLVSTHVGQFSSLEIFMLFLFYC